jgi:prepilin-type N-terminal cleavage/methylation domain-containing protein
MLTPTRTRTKRGFTLIELLIVIAIILILIAIALPNFLEAQERARVTRAKAELRTMETAVNTHIVDYGFLYADFNDDFLVTTVTRNKKRLQREPCGVFNARVPRTSSLTFSVDPANFYAPNIHCPLTTPIRYIDAKATTDPWGDGTIPIGMDSREVSSLPGRKLSPENGSTIVYSAYFVSGPDRNCGDWIRGSDGQYGAAYNPTNGTKSKGELWMVIATTDTQFAKNEYVPLRTF